ncbi:hypothetical protein MPTK1_1g26650 [Marchantia polymorpha subsp. ruderalis]|uniref:Uncharacterized protein n=2 Tax=Marchantia polymorpha TaxID=3197 RepID=A0AAF6AUK8_MARPO|nr:hypothetical protein MARPO_0002s0213 [Marchantia polymorpha]BBN00129.1 hypothetical protein Mp_1g26650 [Marchantia polymorpha subsp. ruderalis]|eukprot:PTQ49755.1 hypothetical protein MARPO_0002s0213 [Marchantia polymorpha]
MVCLARPSPLYRNSIQSGPSESKRTSSIPLTTASPPPASALRELAPAAAAAESGLPAWPSNFQRDWCCRCRCDESCSSDSSASPVHAPAFEDLYRLSNQQPTFWLHRPCSETQP